MVRGAALLFVALACTLQDAESMPVGQMAPETGMKPTPLTPLAALRAKAAALRGSLPVVDVGEGKGKEEEGSNSKNAVSPEQRPGAGLFPALAAAKAAKAAHTEAKKSIPGPFGHDKVTKNLSTTQQQDLLTMVKQYNDKRKLHLIEKNAHIQEKAAEMKVKLDVLRAKQALHQAELKKAKQNLAQKTSAAHKAATVASKASVVANVAPSQTATANDASKVVRVEETAAQLHAPRAVLKKGPKETKQGANKSKLMTELLAANKNLLSKMQQSLSKHTHEVESEAKTQLMSAKGAARAAAAATAADAKALAAAEALVLKAHKKLQKDSVIAGKYNSDVKRLQTTAAAKQRVTKVLSSYKKDMAKYANNVNKLTKQRVAALKGLNSAEHHLKADQATMRAEIAHDVQTVKGEARSLHQVTDKLRGSRAHIQRELSDDLSIIKNQLRKDQMSAQPPARKKLSTTKGTDSRVYMKRSAGHLSPELGADRGHTAYLRAERVLSKLAQPLGEAAEPAQTAQPKKPAKEKQPSTATTEGTKSAEGGTAATPKPAKVLTPQETEAAQKAAEKAAVASLPHSATPADSKPAAASQADPKAPQNSKNPKKAAPNSEAAQPAKAQPDNAKPAKAQPAKAQPAKEAHPAAVKSQKQSPPSGAERSAASDSTKTKTATESKTSHAAKAQGAKMQEKETEAEIQAAQKANTSILNKMKAGSPPAPNKSNMKQQAEQAAQKTAAAEAAKKPESAPKEVAVPASKQSEAKKPAVAATPASKQSEAKKPAAAATKDKPAAAAKESKADLAAKQKQAEIAAEEKVAWEQKQKDDKNIALEQKLVEQAQMRRAKGLKPPSEVAKAEAEVEAEHVLAKEKENAQAQSKQGKPTVHKVDGPASASVVSENAHKVASSKEAQKAGASKNRVSEIPAKVAPKATDTHAPEKHEKDKRMVKWAEALAEKTVVAEDAAKERKNKGTR